LHRTSKEEGLALRALKVKVPREVYEELLKKIAEIEGAGQ